MYTQWKINDNTCKHVGYDSKQIVTYCYFRWLTFVIKITRLSSYVSDPPGKPQIADPGELTENEVTSFTCTSEGGYPEPTFTWIKGGVELPKTQATETRIDGKPASILQTKLLYTDHMTDLICKASNVLDTTETARRLDIKCKYHRVEKERGLAALKLLSDSNISYFIWIMAILLSIII